VLLFVNFLFLLMGGLLYLYAAQTGNAVKGDDLFPSVALGGTLSTVISVIFIIGLISALFPSADGALTALTSSFCIDILGLKKNELLTEKKKRSTRLTVHMSFAALFFLLVMLFKWIDDKSIIDVILKVAGYTYGPLLGLFAFGILTKRRINDRYALIVCLLSPLLIFGVDLLNNPDWYVKHFNLSAATGDTLKNLSVSIFHGFKMGIEILILNGLVTFLGLLSISKKDE
jgi:Na+/pantothenate symporter